MPLNSVHTFVAIPSISQFNFRERFLIRSSPIIAGEYLEAILLDLSSFVSSFRKVICPLLRGIESETRSMVRVTLADGNGIRLSEN